MELSFILGLRSNCSALSTVSSSCGIGERPQGLQVRVLTITGILIFPSFLWLMWGSSEWNMWWYFINCNNSVSFLLLHLYFASPFSCLEGLRTFIRLIGIEWDQPVKETEIEQPEPLRAIGGKPEKCRVIQTISSESMTTKEVDYWEGPTRIGHRVHWRPW